MKKHQIIYAEELWGITDIDMFTGLDKEQTAIALIQSFQPVDDYYVANSGGKDSEVSEHLTMRATSRYQSYYCVSPIDPKEVHQFIREHCPNTIWEYHAKNFWATVVRKGLPMRQARWCCSLIKEAGGVGRVVIVGNRRDEGANRSKQKCFEKHHSQDKFFLRPIINWTHEEVWEYIRKYNLPYNPIYDEGCPKGTEGYGKGRLKRLGCVLCPFSRAVQYEIERFPKIAYLWRRACDQIVADRLARGNISKRGKPYKHQHKTGQELWEWWIRRK